VAGAATVLAAVIAGGLASSAGAVNASVLATANNPPPACSEESPDDCQITGQVTGYQRSVRGESNPFRVKNNGRIVAWSISLARPSAEEREIFGEAAKTDEFGKSPTAGISILRKVKGEGRQFKLVRSSPILEVQAHYGSQPIFTLRNALRAKKGDIVGLTTATWLPAFAFKGQGAKDVWIASRRSANCEIPDSVPADERLAYFFAHTAPHRKAGSKRRYECMYDNARLLYKAYFTPSN
jgi:hypothetical protein